MASRLYPLAREYFLTAQLSWLVGDYRALLLPESYSPNFSNTYLADVFEGVRIDTSEIITGRTATSGFANCDPIEFPLLTDTRLISQAIIYKDTGDEASSLLVAYLASEDLIGTPYPAAGLDFFIYPNSVEGGLFRL